MHLSASVVVKAPRHLVWQVVTDIENAPSVISGIEDTEILDKPANGIVGLKWMETRTMFGKTATETMWITDAVKDDYYRTEARSHGCIYRSKIHLDDADGSTRLTMDFDAEPTTISAMVLGSTLGLLFKGATRKALLQDLKDVKTALENERSQVS